ncbi:hypothetical protein RB595_006816 [Gaeumannomyces hyphopodioides]
MSRLLHKHGKPGRKSPPSSLSHLLALQIMATALLLPFFGQLTQAKEPTSTPAQRSAPFVDQATGLTMERFFGARTSFGYAMALPENTASTSFIGQFQFPLANGNGYGAMGFIGDMDDNFILAVWPDSKGGVLASFRQATDEDNPPEVTGRFRVRPIASGVAVNATSLLYTFLCEDCLDPALGLGPEQAAADAVMGWALSARQVSDAANPGARLGFHERGFGPFTARLGNARVAQAQFDAVAALAGEAVAASARATPVVLGAGQGKDNKGDDSDSDSDDDGDDD